MTVVVERPCPRCQSAMISGPKAYCPPCRREYGREYARRPERRPKRLAATRKSDLRRAYGLTPAQYDEMLESQGGVCAICGETTARRLAVDHAHDTGAIRGLLCTRCNPGLGYFRDNPVLLDKAIHYLFERDENAAVA